MNFSPKTADEISTFSLLEKGVYNFRVTKAEDQISKSGNEMIKLTLQIWDKAGDSHFIFDYLLEKAAYKLRHFAECCGLIDKYNLGAFSAGDCEGREGKVDIIVQPGQPKPDGGFYADKNAVKDYVVGDKVVSILGKRLPSVKIEEGFDDDFPF